MGERGQCQRRHDFWRVDLLCEQHQRGCVFAVSTDSFIEEPGLKSSRGNSLLAPSPRPVVGRCFSCSVATTTRLHRTSGRGHHNTEQIKYIVNHAMSSLFNDYVVSTLMHIISIVMKTHPQPYS
jgi:hypothetical protein